MGVEDGAGAAENTWGDGSEYTLRFKLRSSRLEVVEVEGRLPGGGGRG